MRSLRATTSWLITAFLIAHLYFSWNIILKLPWYYGWNIVAVTLVFQCILFGSIFYSYTLWVGEWLDDASLAVTLTYVMVPITALTLAQAAASPFIGYALDRYSIRSLICIGASMAGIGFFLISKSSAFWQIVVIYGSFLMAGILLAGPLAAQTLAAKWFNRNRSLAMGLSTTGTSLGGVFMAPMVTLLYQKFGWREAHEMLSVVFIVVIIPLVWFTIRNSPKDKNIEPEVAREEERGGKEITGKFWSTAEILRERTFWGIIFSFLPMIVVFSGIQQHFRPYAGGLGIGTMETAYLVSIVASVMILGKIFFGTMADRIDHRLLFGVMLIVFALAITGLLSGPDYGLLVVLSGLLGFAAGGFLPLLGAIISRHFGVASFGSVMGLLGPFLAVAAFGPILFSQLHGLYSSYNVALWISLILIIPSVIAIRLLPKPINK